MSAADRDLLSDQLAEPLSTTDGRPEEERHRKVTGRGKMIIMIAVAAAAPMALCAWVSYQTRVQTLESAVTEQIHTVEARSENTTRLLEAQALALDLIERQAGELDCPALRSNLGLQELMTSVTRQSTESLWLINADGFLCMANDPTRLDNRNRAFREYFSGARNIGAGHYYVDRALIGLSGSRRCVQRGQTARKEWNVQWSYRGIGQFG